MSPKQTILSIIVFFVILWFVSAKTEVYQPKQVQSPRPNLLPIDYPKSLNSLPSAIKDYLSPTPNVSPFTSPLPESTSEPKATGPFEGSLRAVLDSFFGEPFGGRISNKHSCDCSANDLITVGPPKGGIFIVDFTTRIYREHAIDEGNWVLGKASGFGICVDLECGPEGCVCIPNGGGPVVEIIGTNE